MRAYSLFEGTTWRLRVALDPEDDIHGRGQWDIPIELVTPYCRLELAFQPDPHPDLIELAVLTIVRPWAKQRLHLNTPVSDHLAEAAKGEFGLENWAR